MDCSPPAPLSMGCSRQEYWSGLPFPSPGDLPNPGIEPKSPAWQAGALSYMCVYTICLSRYVLTYICTHFLCDGNVCIILCCNFFFHLIFSVLPFSLKAKFISNEVYIQLRKFCHRLPYFHHPMNICASMLKIGLSGKAFENRYCEK